ncbi:MAG: cell division protein ZapA [Clostridia bacterium]|nr:cell division protein ZapA [Clostridia bacterium]MBO7320009.1 cell division protein ZapA [Clostridia bacterium]
MAATKIKLYIAGVEYSIIAEDDVKYVQELGRDLDRALTKIMKESPRLSTTQAAVLAALSYADECKKASDSADRLREQIKDYLDDASNAKSKADWARHELEEAKKQIDALTIDNSRLRAELNAVLGAVSGKNSKVVPINGNEK